MVHGGCVHLGFNATASEQSLDLRSKAEYAVAMKEKKRLLTDVIAREKQSMTRTVPDRERKHTAQVAHAVGAVLFVQMDDDFGVRGSLELVTVGLEVPTEIKKVVDLAVKNDPNGAVFVRDWLAAVLDVNDAQPTMSQADHAVEVITLVVRAAVPERLLIDRIRCSSILNGCQRPLMPHITPLAFSISVSIAC